MKNSDINLLSFCEHGGCGAKIGAGELSSLLKDLNIENNPNLLLGFESSDDACVYKIENGKAILSTVDFFPPMINDPYIFGKIAAANALSDIYAMGGKPLFALNIVSFPEKLDREILKQILTGGAEKVSEAGAIIAGGHSIYDKSIKYGLSVTGMVDVEKVIRNNTCKKGDALILTKALGTGLILSALRIDEAKEREIKTAIFSMERLNKYSSEKFYGKEIHAVTDITGFGLAVHGYEMAGSSHTLIFNAESLPILDGALYYAENHFATAGSMRNRNFMKGKISTKTISPIFEEIVYDPQTSGGLLISVSSDIAQELCDEIKKDDPLATIVGCVTEREEFPVIVL